MSIIEIIESNEAVKIWFPPIDPELYIANNTLYYYLIWEDSSEMLIKEVMKSISELYENGIEFLEAPVYTIILEKRQSQKFLYDRRNIENIAKPRDQNSLASSYYMQNMWDSISNIYLYTWIDHSLFAEFIPPEEFFDPDFMNSDPIAAGGDSCVYKNILFGQEVAIKVPNKQSDLKTIWKEIKMTKLSRHKNVLDILGIVISNNCIGIIFEFCERTLKQHSLQPSITINEKLDLLIEISQGLTWIHFKGICHLDIKPQNILIDKYNTPKICDFNISEFQSSKPTNKTKFTLKYAAPEQVQLKVLDKSSDIWSFGMTMFETLLNEKPFERNIKTAYPQGLENLDNYHGEFLECLVFRRWKPLIDADFEKNNSFLCSIIRETWSFDKSLRPSSKHLNLELKECKLMLETEKEFN